MPYCGRPDSFTYSLNFSADIRDTISTSVLQLLTIKCSIATDFKLIIKSCHKAVNQEVRQIENIERRIQWRRITKIGFQ
jgi:hypothetical protein